MNKLLDKKTLKQLNQLPNLGKSKPRSNLGPLVSLVLVVGLLAWVLLQMQKSNNVPNTQADNEPKTDSTEPGQADTHQQMGATEKQVQHVNVPHAGEPAEVETDKASDDQTEIIIDPQSELTPG